MLIAREMLTLQGFPRQEVDLSIDEWEQDMKLAKKDCNAEMSFADMAGTSTASTCLLALMVAVICAMPWRDQFAEAQAAWLADIMACLPKA